MKYVYLLSILFLLSINGYAQDFTFGTIGNEDMDLKKSPVDSNANAVVLREFGTSRMEVNDVLGRMEVIFNYHVRIKIFNKKGFENGNVQIMQRIYDDVPEEISEIQAVTINFIDGVLQRSVLDPKKIFNERKSKYRALTKFTLPNLMEGSVIEYSYRIITPSIFNFRGWDFQSDIPKLKSEYIAQIPALYNYNASLRGPLKLTKQNAEIKRECIRVQGTPIDCSKITYMMENIPAFVEEDYMTAAKNFRSAMKFELSDYYLMNGGKKSITKTWKDVDYELVNEKSFGSQMKRKDAFKELLPTILNGATDSLAKAKAIYAYISKNIKSNGYIGIYSETAVKKALESHSGNTGDINLALVSALAAADLDAEAVILSTRENGYPNNLFPVISDFNYVVAKVNIGGESYLLDASTPLLPFGLLPLDCISGQGRVINLKKPSYWYNLKASQKDLTRYTFNAELAADGKIKGKLINNTSGYSGLQRRERIGKFNSIDEYVEKLDEDMPGINIKNHEVQNVDSLDHPLAEIYDIEITDKDGPKMPGAISFNPFIFSRITKNPFNLNDRTYPVDMGTLKETRVNIAIKLPENYEITNELKSLSIALPENAARYICNTELIDNTLYFNQVIQFNRPIYDPEDYLALKEFYSRIIQQQKTDIIIKKKK